MLQELNLQELTAIDGGGIGYVIGYIAREVYDFIGDNGFGL